MADVPECFGEYNKISNSERAENDCRTCPFLEACAKVPNPLADAFLAGWNACEADVKRLRAENERLSVGNRRYEIARRLDPRQWAAAFELNIKTGKAFDQIIDEMGPPVSPNA